MINMVKLPTSKSELFLRVAKGHFVHGTEFKTVEGITIQDILPPATATSTITST